MKVIEGLGYENQCIQLGEATNLFKIHVVPDRLPKWNMIFILLMPVQ